MSQNLVDLVNGAQNSLGLASQAYTVSTQGDPVDFKNCENSLNAVLNAGTFGANSTGATVKIQECATTNGTFTDITGMAFTAITTTVSAVQAVRGIRSMRYVRVNAITVSGTTASINFGVTIHSQLRYSGTGGGYDRSPST